MAIILRTNDRDNEYLFITTIVSWRKHVIEKLPSYNSGLYYTFINPVESNMTINTRSVDPTNFTIWHDRLDHPGSTMMRRIIENSNGHPLKNKIVPLSKDFSCVACIQGKLITKPSPVKVAIECQKFWSEFKEIYVDQLPHLVGHFSTLWYSLMHQQDGHMLVYCPLVMLLLHDSLLK